MIKFYEPEFIQLQFQKYFHTGTHEPNKMHCRTRLEQCFSTAGPRPSTGPWDQWSITNLNVILYLSTCHTVYISVLIFFMIMP
jgi:hypothetical protein